MTNTQNSLLDLEDKFAQMGISENNTTNINTDTNTSAGLSEIGMIYGLASSESTVVGTTIESATLNNSSSNETLLQNTNEFDFLQYIDTEITKIETSPVIESKPKTSYFSEKIKERIRFGVHYIAATSVVFGILLVATNWSAYSAIAHNYLNPVELQDASNKLESALSQSKITVYANEEEESLHSTELSVKAEDIKNQLKAESENIDEEPFAIQSLIPTKPTVSVSFEITPYENRIIIPKIGKNIPLVDIAGNSGFDFDHMENIFMQELEKGVVRYPGTALPGQPGNSFIFGHSSNYPWIKGDYNDVFALIDNLEFGDKIIVYYNQKRFVYTIREKKIIKPGDVKALERDQNKTELSLMTCWPIGTTLKRMLVFAELTND